jgi:hypothetical protein
MIIITNNDEVHFFLTLTHGAEPCLLEGGIDVGGRAGFWHGLPHSFFPCTEYSMAYKSSQM